MAYEAKDLLHLFELQLEVELVDSSRIAALSEERLRHYVSILEEQCAELQQVLDDAQMPIRLQLDLSPFAKLSANSVVAEVEQHARELNTSSQRCGTTSAHWLTRLESRGGFAIIRWMRLSPTSMIS